ncbi:MAG: glycosyltransferase family 2 protein [Terriglobia bacterium]
MSPRIIAFFPLYNEKSRLDSLLQRFKPVLEKQIVHELLIVDDGSTDGSYEVLRQQPCCTVVRHESNQGMGDALRDAYRYALEKQYDIFTIIAGNGKDDPAEIERLVGPILRDKADYMQGSRFLPHGYSEGLPGHRLWAMRLYTWTFSLFLTRKFTDCTNGFRAYRTLILRDKRLDWAQEWLGHSYEIEFYVHYKVTALEYRVAEVPVSKIYHRASNGSYSKVRVKDWFNNLKPLFLLRFGIKS